MRRFAIGSSAPRQSRDALRTPATLLLLFALLSGGLSLARVSSKYEGLGVLGEARYWLFLAALVLALPVVLSDWRRSHFRRISRRSVWIWLSVVTVLHLYLILSLLWSPRPSVGAASVSDVFLMLAMLWTAAALTLPASVQSIALVFSALFWVAVAFFLGGVLGNWSDPEGLKAFWAGAIGFSRVVGPGALAAVYLWARDQRARWLLALPPLVLGVLLSGSRAAAIATVLVAGVFAGGAIVRTPTTRGKLQRAAMLLALMLVLLPMMLFPFVRERLDAFWTTMWVPGATHRGLRELRLADRNVLFATAWRMFLDRPVAGNGLGSFEVPLGAETYTYPHNLVLGIAADGGVIGLGIFSLAALLLLFRLTRSIAMEHRAAFALGIFSLLVSLFSGTYYDARLMWFAFLLYLLPPGRPADTRAAG